MTKNIFSARSILSLGALLVALFVGTPAKAATVNFFGSNDDMGLVAVGQNGTIINLSNDHGEQIAGSAEGILPAYSQITFTYSFKNAVSGEILDDATYKEKIGNKNYRSYVSGDHDDNYSYFYTNNVNNKTNVPSPIFATANIDPSGKQGTAVITNKSDTTVTFSSYFVAFFSEICDPLLRGDVVVTYVVTSVVPLPASFWLFAMALAGIVVISRKNKNAV